MSANMMASRISEAEMPTYPLDTLLLGVVLALITIGVIMVASSTTEISLRDHGTPAYLIVRHVIFLGASMCIGFCVLLLPIAFWKKCDRIMLLVSLALLTLVLIPGIGREVNGSIRWISLGVFSMQSSEVVKLLVIVYLCGYLERRQDELVGSWRGFAKPLLVLLVISFLLLMEPDYGAVVVITIAAMGLIFLAGVPLRRFFPAITVSLLLLSVIAVLQTYRLQRLLTFTDPWEHQFSSGYQLTQALIAFGRGEWFGVGLGNSLQKLFFLPEAHTDFLFSIIAEELGAIGALVVISLFLLLVWRALWIGQQALKKEATFAGLLAFGIALLIASQAFINIGVNLGLLPTKGLTLPFVSYGGSSLLVSIVLATILLRIDYETRCGQSGEDRT